MASDVSGVMDDLDGLWDHKWKKMDEDGRQQGQSFRSFNVELISMTRAWQKDRGGLPAYVKCAIQARLVSFIGLTGLFTLGIGLCADTPPISIIGL